MSYITDILYWISTGLLVPVIVLLIALFVRSLLLIGSFFGQYIAIRKTEALLRIEFDALTAENMDTLADRLPKKSNTLVVKSIRKIMEEKDSPAHVSRLLADYEILADKDLATSKTLSKMGPMLGLMGTLIPLGTGLAALGSGDINTLSTALIVAFDTTVVGIGCGALAYVISKIRYGWYDEYLSNLDVLSDAVLDFMTIHC